MGLLSWIVFGALAGWVASIIAGTNNRQGCITNIIVGVAGAFVGGFISNRVFGQAVLFDWSWRSFGIAVIGAVLLLALFGRKRR
ncbi:MAG: GlsB/YeaQ/YmgE family stress response membrane protein [Chloroflexi bacterium]|nr:GlsB/YeaQ/YmgE family stress response membrane protein [Chloroflexota bacterium]